MEWVEWGTSASLCIMDYLWHTYVVYQFHTFHYGGYLSVVHRCVELSPNKYEKVTGWIKEIIESELRVGRRNLFLLLFSQPEDCVWKFYSVFCFPFFLKILPCMYRMFLSLFLFEM